ncbi:MarR family winged helix-turn-helix transcriptional regulator [Streptomyces sp. NBC_00091]|uniref:MarR family winged helix-turn-helix transcriptional regulator n=1 Tax=Streptomyces sp. NBC_00091 TaxID=2975648 RepID=UPI00224DC53F|nr:MarR family transcriptional regulator [Streptomyces sp. NBC_00091]MCX5376111.1 MarR family transcriptional regulator [Streptomyces sp. NBC_00091]
MTSMPPEERIGAHIKRAEQALLAAKNAAVKPAAVTVPQYAALLWLAEKPGISAAALARLCGVTPPTMNTVLKNLHERGLIERTPHEWHRNVLETRLTPEGHAAMELADAGAVRVETALATALSAQERTLLIELLGRCSEVLDTLK